MSKPSLLIKHIASHSLLVACGTPASVNDRGGGFVGPNKERFVSVPNCGRCNRFASVAAVPCSGIFGFSFFCSFCDTAVPSSLQVYKSAARIEFGGTCLRFGVKLSSSSSSTVGRVSKLKGGLISAKKAGRRRS